jgi:hypothetical protein
MGRFFDPQEITQPLEQQIERSFHARFTRRDDRTLGDSLPQASRQSNSERKRLAIFCQQCL